MTRNLHGKSKMFSLSSTKWADDVISRTNYVMLSNGRHVRVKILDFLNISISPIGTKIANKVIQLKEKNTERP